MCGYMKITIYTLATCQYCRAEKDYLAKHNLPFEEKNVESKRENLAEMLTVGNNFAGTPVTKIEKDDGSVVVLKGFSQEEFDKELGLAPTAPTVDATAPAIVPDAAATPPAPEPAAAPTTPSFE